MVIDYDNSDARPLLEWEKREKYKQAQSVRMKSNTTDFEPMVFRPSRLTAVGLHNISAPSYVVERLGIEKGTLINLCGASWSSKTLFAQYLGLCVSGNQKAFGQYDIDAPGKVLHIDQEQTEAQTQRRYERLSAGLGCTQYEIDRWKLPFKLGNPIIDKQIEDLLIDACSGYSMVILDSLRRATSTDENDSRISLILDMLKRVAEESDCAFMFIHHKGKAIGTSAQTGRGSSAIFDACDVQIDLDRKDGALALSCAKVRDSVPFTGISYRLEDCGEYLPLHRKTRELRLVLVDANLPTLDNARTAKKSVIVEALKKDGPKNLAALEKLVGGGKAARDIVLQCVSETPQIHEVVGQKQGKGIPRIFKLNSVEGYQ